MELCPENNKHKKGINIEPFVENKIKDNLKLRGQNRLSHPSRKKTELIH